MQMVRERARVFKRRRNFRHPNGGSQNEKLLNNSDDDENSVSNRETYREFLRSESIFFGVCM